jgi:polyisoprenoid-binding protein YceI
MKGLRAVVCGLVALSSSIALSAGKWTIDSASSSVGFEAETTGDAFNIDATGGKASGVVSVDDAGYATGTVDVDLAGVDTKNPTRNEHMHTKYLETKKWPKATLKLEAWKLSETETQLCGQLTIKGETKRQCGKASAKDEAGAKVVTAWLAVNIKDYKAIELPVFSGAILDPNIKIKASLKAKK